MDYAFAPGTTPSEDLVRNMFTRRGNTSLIGAANDRSTVKEFIDHLNTTASIVKPINDILIGTHANSQGQLAIPPFQGQQGPTTYERIEDTIGNTARSINVPDSLIGYTTGSPVTKHFHIKGCNIGKARQVLTKLKLAVGSHLLITAPLHFHDMVENRNHGTWELMSYEFRILRKTAFANRSAYLAALGAAGFRFYNNDPVTAADWSAWVPPNISGNSSTRVVLNLGVTLNNRTTIPFNRSFRYENTVYTYTINYSTASGIPSGTANRMAALSTALDNFKYRPSDTVGGFDSAHPYPEYVRWGYTSKQNFLDEHDWSFSVSGTTLVCAGRFHQYTLLIPVTDRTAANMGNIIFNFYPIASTGLSAITTGLPVTNASFFATV